MSEVGARQRESMERFYPQYDGSFPWGYLWASTLPCRECGRRFPLVGELQLRRPDPRSGDPGQSFYLEPDRDWDDVTVVVHDGVPRGTPTRVLAGKSKYASEGR